MAAEKAEAILKKLQSAEITESMRSRYLRRSDDGEDLVDSELLGKDLQAADDLWTDQRLLDLFKVMDRNQDGKVQFEEFLFWFSSTDRSELDLSYAPVGAKPLIEMKIILTDGVKARAKSELNAPEVFLASVAKKSPLSQLRSLLCLTLGIREESLTFMHSGRTVDCSFDLEGNDITVPGVAARKKGEKAELQVDFNWATLEDCLPAPRALMIHLFPEDWMLTERQRLQKEEERMRKRREEEAEKKKRDIEDKKLRVHDDFYDYIRDVIGVSEELREELLNSPERLEAWQKKNVVAVQNHFLIPESDEVAQFFRRSVGEQFKVLKVYRNQNETLLRRYNHAKESLRQDAANITKERIGMLHKFNGEPPVDFLGPYEREVNEFPLWHGTPSAETAGGISEIGFDTNRITVHVWGHGFYFADDWNTSAAYSRSGFTVNELYSSVKVMFLCRVLAGRILRLGRPPTAEEQEGMVADCLGPGGCFGPKSKYHTFHGGGYAYVAAHRDQVYPAYIILYQ